MFKNKKTILITLVLVSGIATNIANADFTFGEPTNLGPTVNSSDADHNPSISAEGLSLSFSSYRPGGSGDSDIWVTTRATTNDDWGEPINLGPIINSSAHDGGPCLSADGLAMYFESGRGGYGSVDLWITTRATLLDPWSEPVNLGPIVNSSADELYPAISFDGLHLFFTIIPRSGLEDSVKETCGYLHGRKSLIPGRSQ